MQRTYYIVYPTIYGEKVDKIIWDSPDTRPNWHKVEALTWWQKRHRGYWYLNISCVYTIKEYKAYLAKKETERKE